SFFSIDEFSGLIKREFTLSTYGELFSLANLDIIQRSLLMSIAVTLAAALIAFPVAYYAARFAKGRWKAFFYLAVMLPLWSSYFLGQAVYTLQGTAGNVPLAAAFTVVPIVIMAAYLTIAKRMGAFDAL